MVIGQDASEPLRNLRSHGLFASAILAAGTAALTIAAEPPLETWPLQRNFWITARSNRMPDDSDRETKRPFSWIFLLILEKLCNGALSHQIIFRNSCA
jgi:hypothetical protein